MKKLDWNWWLGGLLAVLGILICIFPEQFQKFIVVLLGLCAAAYGIYGLVATKNIFDNTVFEKTILVRSIVSIVIGAIAIIFPIAIGKAMWTAMVYILVIYLVLSAVAGFYTVSLLKGTDIDRKRYIWENISILLIAVVLVLINADKLGDFITRLFGIIVLICGAGIITLQIVNDRKVITVDAEVVDVSAADEKSDDSAVTENASDSAEKASESETSSEEKTE